MVNKVIIYSTCSSALEMPCKYLQIIPEMNANSSPQKIGTVSNLLSLIQLNLTTFGSLQDTTNGYWCP